MKPWIHALILALFILSAAALPAQAQENITIERLQIDLWPEYDQPGVLVIYHITLAGETSLPANLSLRIPARAGAPYNVAFQNVDGMLLNLEYTTQTDGEWLVVSFVALSSVLQIEYYDPALQVDGANRSFEYTWPADVRVRSLTINAQQPRTASQMTTSMTGAVQQVGADGLQYSLASFGLIDAGKPLTISLSYQKDDDQLSLGAAPVAPIQTNGSPTASLNSAGGTNATTWLILLIVAILILAAAVFWYTWQIRCKQAQATARRRHDSSRHAGLDEVGFNEAGDVVYCAQCGRRAAPGDLFCRTCGTPLHK